MMLNCIAVMVSSFLIALLFLCSLLASCELWASSLVILPLQIDCTVVGYKYNNIDSLGICNREVQPMSFESCYFDPANRLYNGWVYNIDSLDSCHHEV